MSSTAQRPKGRSMKELRAIIAAEDARRDRLMSAWDEMTEADQLSVVEFAEKISSTRVYHDRSEKAEQEAAAMLEP